MTIALQVPDRADETEKAAAVTVYVNPPPPAAQDAATTKAPAARRSRGRGRVGRARRPPR